MIFLLQKIFNILPLLGSQLSSFSVMLGNNHSRRWGRYIISYRQCIELTPIWSFPLHFKIFQTHLLLAISYNNIQFKERIQRKKKKFCNYLSLSLSLSLSLPQITFMPWGREVQNQTQCFMYSSSLNSLLNFGINWLSWVYICSKLN